MASHYRIAIALLGMIAAASAEEPTVRPPSAPPPVAGAQAAPARPVGIRLVVVQRLNGMRVPIEHWTAEPGDEVAGVKSDGGAASAPRQLRALSAEAFNELIYSGLEREQVRSQYEEQLGELIKTIDTGPKLSETQKQKLLLAGKGDIHRLLNRAEAFRPKFEQSWEVDDTDPFRIPEAIADMLHDAGELRLQVASGPFRGNSMCEKMLLQVSARAKVREIERRFKDTRERRLALSRGRRIHLEWTVP